MNILLKAMPVTEAIMNDLEEKGVLRRIMPGKDILPTKHNESRHASVYEADESFGPHKLICVTINTTIPSNFLYHNDNEDFMLIDLPDREDLVITMSLIPYALLEQRIRQKKLEADDFISLIFKPNDPYLSFFTMNAGYAHVETCARTSDKPPSFYVAESRDLDENHIDFRDYQLRIEV